MCKTGEIIRVTFALIILFFFTSCGTELDMIDSTADLPVVWGLIDPSDSIYRIRIQKSFSGRGNALQMAKVYDSIYFDSLNVSLELRLAPDKEYIGIDVSGNWIGEYNVGGALIHRVRLTRQTIDDKLPGLFNNSIYRLYQTSSDLFDIRGKSFVIDPGYFTASMGQGFVVRLGIENPKTRQTTVATTPFVDMPNILLPRKAFTLNLYAKDPSRVIWQDHGWYYTTQIQFYYSEYTDHEEIKCATWRISGINRTEVLNGPLKFYVYTATPFQEGLLGHVRAQISDDPKVVWRKFREINYYITASPNFVQDYMESYSISSDHSGQAITNVTDGYGLFAIVSTNGRKGFGLDPVSQDSLANGRITKKLKFVRW